MRKSVASVILLLAMAGAAQADEWCRRDVGSRQTYCHFSSLSQCSLAVRVSGGICERSHDRAAARPSYDRYASSGHGSHSGPTYGANNYSRLRASYTPELGHITYHGKPACD